MSTELHSRSSKKVRNSMVLRNAQTTSKNESLELAGRRSVKGPIDGKLVRVPDDDYLVGIRA